MCPQLLNYTSLIIYYHLIFLLLFFHNGPSTKKTQLQQNYGVPTQQHISKVLLLPILQAQALVAMNIICSSPPSLMPPYPPKFTMTFPIPTSAVPWKSHQGRREVVAGNNLLEVHKKHTAFQLEL